MPSRTHQLLQIRNRALEIVQKCWSEPSHELGFHRVLLHQAVNVSCGRCGWDWSRLGLLRESRSRLVHGLGKEAAHRFVVYERDAPLRTPVSDSHQQNFSPALRTKKRQWLKNATLRSMMVIVRLSSMASDIHDVCDYVILRCAAAGAPMNMLKLQKLLYYSQAWSLAMSGKPLFQGKFQAWVHGPVSREIYDRFVESKSLYSAIGEEDVSKRDAAERIDEASRNVIDRVLENYAKFSGTQLEIMTHREEPWIHARGGIPDLQRCENEIDEKLMTSFYGSRLKQS